MSQRYKGTRRHHYHSLKALQQSPPPPLFSRCHPCLEGSAETPCGLAAASATSPAQSSYPCLSSASLPCCRRHHSYRQVSLPFYGRKMNCLPSSAARDDRTESCHLLWFWQPQQPRREGAPGMHRGKSTALATLLRRPPARPASTARACSGSLSSWIFV